MSRNAVITVAVLLGLVLAMFITRPTMETYERELNERANRIIANDGSVEGSMVGSNPLDQMMAIITPEEAVRRTEFKDLYVITMFTTGYDAPNIGHKRLHTMGLFGQMITSQEQ